MFRSLLRLMVRLSAPNDRRDMIIDDLDEEWVERIRPQTNSLRARWWYLQESLSLTFAFLVERITGRTRSDFRTINRRGTMLRRIVGTGWFQDVRYAVRGLVRAPSFSMIAVLTLAIGMGGTVIMFSLAHAAYLRPLPFPDADRLVRIFTGYEHDTEGRNAISPLTWQDARERPDLVQHAEVWEQRSYHLGGDGAVRRIAAARVSPGFLSLMGASPHLGRLFTEEEAVPGADRSTILSHGMWTETFGADSSILGRTVILDDSAYQVVGVMRRVFDLPRAAELWVPLSLAPQWYTPERRGWEFLEGVARLQDGITPSFAGAGLTEQLARVAPDRVANVGQRVNVVALREHLVGNAGGVLLILLTAVGLVLLIASANVTNLLLARAERRRHEFALRRALGVGSGRLARLIVFETTALCVAGGLLGVVGAITATRLIAVSPPEAIADLGPLSVRWRILLLATALSAGPVLVFSLAPVLGALRARPLEILGGNATRTTGGLRGSRFRSGLVTAEVALAVVLLFAVGVTGSSFRRLVSVAPGFSANGALSFALEMPAEGFDSARRGDVYRQLLDRVRSLPGVSHAALTYALPLTGVQWSASFELVEPNPSLPEAALGSNMRPVSPGYFDVMRIPLIEGRRLTNQDGPNAPAVVVIDEFVSQRVWSGSSPLGERIILPVFLSGEREATVVGVVGNVRDRDLATPGSGHIYFSAWQSPQRRMVLVARASDGGANLVPSIRSAVSEVESRIPVYNVTPVHSVIDESLTSPRLSLFLMSAFAITAVVLAAIGVFGVFSYTVSSRTREIGTRMALGATPSSVLRLVFRQVTGLWLIGGLIGGATAFALQSVATRFLFDVESGHPIFVAGAVLGLGVVALIAAVVPATRAARLDCVTALREE